MVGPGQYVLFTAQVGIAEMLLQRQRMRQFLAGMCDRLHVDHRHGRVFGEPLEHLVLHNTLQKPLRWWLYAHVPVSLVLVALVAIHLVTVLVY
jgi:hypothetical protein